MTLPTNLFNKYMARFDQLIAKGEEIRKTVNVREGIIDYDSFCQWDINCDSLLHQIIPANNIHQKLIDGSKKYYSNQDKLRYILSILKALKEDFEQGFLGDLMLQIESEIAADYMGQAEQLLAEGATGKYNHVPAAVLSGAVLEKALRTLCDKQNPPLSTINAKGSPLTLNPLIDQLTKASALNGSKAKELKSWADIRNKAAHGEFDQFTRSDVELMIKGIENFLADYMT